MTTRKGLRFSFVAFLVTTFLALACTAQEVPGAKPGGTAEAPAKGGEFAKPAAPQKLTIAVTDLTPLMDPGLRGPGPWQYPLYQAFDGLLDLDEKGKERPRLATSWKQLDETTWEFKLHPGVNFQNGEPVDAEAVKFGIERLIKDERLQARDRIPTAKSVSVVDPMTVRVTTSERDLMLPRQIEFVDLVPPKYYQQVGPDEFGKKPIGTGPFKITEFVPNQRVVLDPWPDSWRGAPQLAQLTFRLIPDPSTRVAALKAGEIDIAGQPPIEAAEELKAGGFTVIGNPGGSMFRVNIDLNHGPPLDNKLVRQALNYAVDKEAIVKRIMGGFAAAAHGQLLGPEAFGYNPDLKAYPFDPNKAKQLLAEAGYPNGFSTTLNGTANLSGIRETTEAIAGYLSQVGIDVKVNIVEVARFREMTRRPQDRVGLWTLNGGNPSLDAPYSLDLYLAKDVRKFYNNPRFDQVYETARKAATLEERERLFREAAAIMYEDPPVIFIFYTPQVYAVSGKVKGFDVLPNNRFYFDKVTKVE